MPQLQSVVLTDRMPTPVNHTFLPRDIQNGVATVVSSTGVVVAEKRLTLSLRRTGTKIKGRMIIAVPETQNQEVNGIVSPVAVRTAIADVQFTFDNGSTTQERKNLIGFLASALDASKTLVNDTFVELQGIY